MHLSRLEIQGFKSFAHKTTFEFSKGVTAIVGPNGSGKSNVADAVRWVLGEQSLKHIRGKKSEDIIFSGSEAKARLGFAEVTITFDNTDHAMPIEYDQVEITRRIYRSGEGEYFLNKSKVRLMDIAELLAKAGFAQRSYGVISQGMIASLVTATPKERFELFEDAAGITQYKIKRDQAVDKLIESTENMAKIQSIIAEIEPHLNSLRRQAKKAEKRELVLKQLHGIQESYFAIGWSDIAAKELEKSTQLNVLAEQIAASQQELNLARSKTTHIREEEEKFTAELREIQDKIQASQEELNKKNGELARIEGLMQVELERKSTVNIDELEQRISQIEKESADIRTQHNALDGSTKKISATILENRKALADLQAAKNELNNKLKICLQEAKKIAAPELGDRIKEIYLHHNNFLHRLSSTRSYDELMSLYAVASTVNNELLTVLRVAQGSAQETHAVASSSPSPETFMQDQVSMIHQSLTEIADNEASIQQHMHKAEVKMASETANFVHLSEKLHNCANEHTELLRKRNAALAAKSQGKSARFVELEAAKQELSAGIKQLETAKEVLVVRLNNKKSATGTSKSVAEKIYADVRTKEKEHERLKDIAQTVRIEKERIAVIKENFLDRMAEQLTIATYSHVLHLELISEKTPINRDEFSQLEQEIYQCTTQLESLGTIEPQILEEFKTTEERYGFLTHQSQDLTQASVWLKEIIAELDAQIDSVFNQSFTQINEQFQKFFTRLFNGGTATLTIEKGEQEAVGVDIKATPPGKKLKNVSVLSGGEKALTSIALLCAILSTNPSPFVLLDEVDAALDEANASRFAEIMSTLTEKSQFIVITHNRQTMKIAHALYGVTMQKDGISKLLSIKFDEQSQSESRSASRPTPRPVSSTVKKIRVKSVKSTAKSPIKRSTKSVATTVTPTANTLETV